MDDDKNDGFFNSFFGGGFDKHFHDALRDMDEVFKKLGEFHIDIQPPSVTVSGNQNVPGYNESPRDMMLKEDVSSDKKEPQHNHGGNNRSKNFHPGFRSPFSSQDKNTGFSDNISEFTIAPGFNFGSKISAQSTSIKHNPDGSLEEIVKTIENGQTCTTVTKTDTSGKTTTTTTCDRPGDIQNIRDKPLSQFPNSPFPPAMPRGKIDDFHNDSDKTIFQKYFADWFKPRDN